MATAPNYELFLNHKNIYAMILFETIERKLTKSPNH